MVMLNNRKPTKMEIAVVGALAGYQHAIRQKMGALNDEDDYERGVKHGMEVALAMADYTMEQARKGRELESQEG
jgi:hypothetical protein